MGQQSAPVALHVELSKLGDGWESNEVAHAVAIEPQACQAGADSKVSYIIIKVKTLIANISIAKPQRLQRCKPGELLQLGSWEGCLASVRVVAAATWAAVWQRS